MAGGSILAVGSLPDVCMLGAAALPVTPVHIWTWARVSCSSMTSDQSLRPDVVWSGFGRGLLPQLLHMALEETLSVYISCTIPGQVQATV